MQGVAETAVMLALFGLGGWEIILILAMVLILVGARKLPEATKRFIDEEAREAGRSVGGIYGKPAAQALTPDNQVAELYDPAVFRDETQQPKRFKGTIRSFVRLWSWIRRFVTSTFFRAARSDDTHFSREAHISTTPRSDVKLPIARCARRGGRRAGAAS